MITDTVAEVAATATDPVLASFPDIFILLEARQNINPQAQLERIVSLPLGENPPLVVFLEYPETHIRVLWVTLSVRS